MTVKTVRTLLYGLGEQHLEVVVSKLFNKYKIEIEFQTKVAFRETTVRNRCRI